MVYICLSSRADIGFSVSCLFLSAISVCLHAVGRSDTIIPNRTTLLHRVNRRCNRITDDYCDYINKIKNQKNN